MGNFCGCILSSDESSCSTAMGNCATRHCQSTCMQEAKGIEEIVDEIMKGFIAKDLYPLLEKQIGSILALQMESLMAKMTDSALLSTSPGGQTLLTPGIVAPIPISTASPATVSSLEGQVRAVSTTAEQKVNVSI